jgi:hypothetical protein
MDWELVDKLGLEYVEYINEVPCVFYTQKSYQKFAKGNENVYTLASLYVTADRQEGIRKPMA